MAIDFKKREHDVHTDSLIAVKKSAVGYQREAAD
jgi:hypothetical protein